MPDLHAQAKSFRADLLKREEAAVKLLSDEYRGIYARLLRKLIALNNQIAAAQAAGQRISSAWLQRQERYGALLRDLDREFQAYSVTVGGVTATRQNAEARQAIADSSALLETATSGAESAFNRLPAAAIQNIVAGLRGKSPLGGMLDKFAPAAKNRIIEALRDAVAFGYNPKRAAKDIRAALGVPLPRALTISRTAMLWSYREASRATYEANQDIVAGWVWLAAKSNRTCLACLAMDGQFFPVTKPLPAHFNCRCTTIPQLRDASKPARETAGEWFEKQPDDVKRKMMSGVAFEAYKAGRVKLSDFAGRAHSREIGEFVYQRTMREIVSGGRKRA